MHNNKKAFWVRLNKIKYYIRRFGIIKTAKKLILPTVTVAALNVSNLNAQEQRPQQLSDRDNIETVKNTLAHNRKVVFNLGNEIDARADWFVDNFLLAAQKHLDALQNSSNKKDYVKCNFFDIVSPRRNLPGSTPYCITALNRALIDANKIAGDLDNVLPNPNSSECYSANECNAFAAFLRKKGFGDCIDEGRIDFNKLQAGDIILTVRNRNGDRHAQQYIGKKNGSHYCLSFNSDGIRELKSSSAIVIHMHQLTRKAIIKNMQKENLIPQKVVLDDVVLPLEQARRIQSYLLRGRENPNQNAPYLAANTYTLTSRDFAAAENRQPNLTTIRRQRSRTRG